MSDVKRRYVLMLTDEEGEMLRTLGRACRKGSVEGQLGIDTTSNLDSELECAWPETSPDAQQPPASRS